MYTCISFFCSPKPLCLVFRLQEWEKNKQPEARKGGAGGGRYTTSSDIPSELTALNSHDGYLSCFLLLSFPSFRAAPCAFAWPMNDMLHANPNEPPYKFFGFFIKVGIVVWYYAYTGTKRGTSVFLLVLFNTMFNTMAGTPKRDYEITIFLFCFLFCQTWLNEWSPCPSLEEHKLRKTEGLTIWWLFCSVFVFCYFGHQKHCWKITEIQKYY